MVFIFILLLFQVLARPVAAALVLAQLQPELEELPEAVQRAVLLEARVAALPLAVLVAQSATQKKPFPFVFWDMEYLPMLHYCR